MKESLAEPQKGGACSLTDSIIRLGPFLSWPALLFQDAGLGRDIFRMPAGLSIVIHPLFGFLACGRWDP